MTVPARYILAALAFAVAALGFVLLPADAAADCGGGGCNRPPPPPCHSCNAPPPPCHSCTPPTIIVPPPHVPPPNIIVVNSGARASAQASATAIAIANVRTGDTIIRSNMIVEGGAAAQASSAAFSVTESSMEASSSVRERMALIQAICLDATGSPHPASQVFGGRDVAQTYKGEIFRCMSGTTTMRVTIEGRTFDCAAGEALWYEEGAVTCKTQITRRPCNERSLLRRFGPGDKMVLIRETETHQTQRETTFNGAMTMDGGVGQSVW